MSLDEWYPFIKLPISSGQFHQLPQNPAYKYEYGDGEAWLTARPKCYHGLLSLTQHDVPESIEGFGREEITFRPLRDEDWSRLPKLFAWAFHRVLPFSLLSDEDRLAAAGGCLEKTRTGGDGQLIEAACFIARCDSDDADDDGGERLMGAVLVTLHPDGDLETFDDARWKANIPDDALEQRWGCPHLTWIFTDYWSARHGLGTTMLDHAANSLMDLGYDKLASTFLLGNESSTLWHWRNGFRLLSYPGSPRAMSRMSDLH